MPRLAVRAFEERDLAAAAALRARRHALDRRRLPMLPAHLESPEACAASLAELLAGPLATAAVAERAGRVVGYMAGRRLLVATDSFMAKFYPPRAASVAGYALVEGEDATDVLGALYARLADEWSDDGFFFHLASVTDGDRAAEEAWADLGFGRDTTFAVRETGAIERRGSADIEVRRGIRDDAELVTRMMLINARHHARSPVFWPAVPEVVPAIREFAERALEDASNAAFFAERNGERLAMHLFLAESFAAEAYRPEGAAYLFDGVTVEAARGQGVGSALLAETMAWAREQGYRYCTLHFASANLSARSFWLGQGFRPLSHDLARRLDERIAWARGEPGGEEAAP
jgi:ribosomal protein S18 acetylase RimI-like enzyme